MFESKLTMNHVLELVQKANLVDRISYAIAGQYGHKEIVSVRYEVYEHDNGDLQEWIIITFIGGGILARNSNMNSGSAICREIFRYVNGGYYDEVDGYLKMTKDSHWHCLVKGGER